MSGEEKLFDASIFARMVEYHRKHRGMSGREAARSIGVSAATYSRVSRGSPPDVETYLRLKRWIEGGTQ